MNYKCEKCHDTGRISKHLSGYLDCSYCDVATERQAMETFLDKLPAMGDYDAAWLVHQRALAMSADHFNGLIKMVPAAAPQVVADERAAFEAMGSPRGYVRMPLDVCDLDYVDSITQAQWEGFQAGRIVAPVQAQEPFAYMIIDDSGEAYFGEFCVAQGKTDLEAELEGLNYGQDGEPYKIVPVFRAPVQPVAVPDINTPVFQALLANYFNAQHATLSASSAAVYGKAIVAEKALISHINSRPIAAPAAQGDAKDAENERAAFESSAKARGYKLDRTGSGCYRDDQLQDAWNMTQDTLAQRAYAYGNFRAAIAAKAAS